MMKDVLKLCFFLAAAVFSTAIAREPEEHWAADWFEEKSNGRLGKFLVDQRRHLQVNCDFLSHGRALSCVQQTASGNNVRYSVTCPAGVTTIDECLQDQTRICYQFNSSPCIGSFFCESTNRFSINCGNLFAKSNGNSCSSTNCLGNCTELRDETVNYNSVDLDNDCFRLGLSSTQSCNGGTCIVTTEWTQVLSNSDLIQVTGTRNSNNNVFETCSVTVNGQAGSSCPCRVNCPAATNSISYDCSDFSTDGCAAVDCDGSCISGGFDPIPAPSPTVVAVPVNVPPVAVGTPVAPVGIPPVTAPVQAPVSVPVSPVAISPVKVPVAVPVTPVGIQPVAVGTPVVPVGILPVTAPVQAPVAVPVTPVGITPVAAPIGVPVTPVGITPVAAPIGVPVTPVGITPVAAPIGVPVTPVALPPVTLTNGTVCALWWGLY